MTEFSSVSLKIETAGGAQAMRALEELDAKGRKLVEAVAGYTGRAMGDVAVAYQRAGERGQDAFRAVAAQAQLSADRILAASKETAQLESAGERLTQRYAQSSVSIARAFEVIGRTGRETGRSLDTLIAQGSQMAFSFGAAGPIVGAIGIATAAVIEMFARASKESKKLAESIVTDFERIAHMDVKGQGEAVSQLYSGDPNAGTYLGQASVPRLIQDRAKLRSQVEAFSKGATGAFGNQAFGVSLAEGERAAKENLEATNKELEKRLSLLASITGPGGSLRRAGQDQARQDLPGFITDQMKESAAAAKAAAAAWNKAVREFSAGIEQRKKAFDALVSAEVGRLTNADSGELSGMERVNRFDRRSFSEGGGPLGHVMDGLIPDAKAIKEMVAEAAKNVTEALKDDPVTKWEKDVKALAARMEHTLSTTLAHGITRGFARAFSGEGISGFFKGLTGTILSAMGGMMEEIGVASIGFGKLMTWLAAALSNPFTAGPAAIAAGVAFLALGAALQAAGASLGRSGGSGAGGGYVSSTTGMATAPDFLTFGVAAGMPPTTSSAAPQRAGAMPPIIVIGSDDPRAQRDIADLVRKASARGLLGDSA